MQSELHTRGGRRAQHDNGRGVDLKGRHAVQMSMHECVFYYWSDEQWDSCDKFREAATPILNPNGVPGLLDWRASDTQVRCLATLRSFTSCLAPARWPALT